MCSQKGLKQPNFKNTILSLDMKITFVMPFYSAKPVGGFKVIYEYANHLAARGHEVTVVHPRRSAWTSPPQLTKLYLRLVGKEKQARSWTSTPEVNWQTIDSRVNMLYVPDATASYIPDGDAVFNNRWVIGEYPPGKGVEFAILQGYGVFPKHQAREDALFRAPIGKIVITRWVYEYGLKLGVPAEDMIIIPNGIDHAKYRILQPLESRAPRIAMLYHPMRVKGAKDGIKALELARDRFPALQAVLFGVFPRPKRLPGWIEYHCDPPQEELVRNIYNGSSIYMCPSWTEGFYLPNAEAMDCGCAVVSTDIGGVRDYAEHGVTALLSPPKNPKTLAENIISLLEHDDLRIRLAKAGHARILQFTWERSTDLLEQFLIERTGGKREMGLDNYSRV